MVVVHGDCGRNLNNEAGYVMDPMYMEASLFIGVSFDLFPLKVPRSRPSSQVGYIEALFGSISTCAWVDPLVGTGSHSDKGYSNLPSHANSLSSTKDELIKQGTYKMVKQADVTRLLLIISFFLLASIGYSEASEADYLLRLIKTRRSSRNSLPQHSLFAKTEYSPVYIEPQQDDSMQLDKINALPGQPSGINFDQYAGYVTVDPKAGRALFYYFVESPQNSSTNPLVLWLNGGPGCSSFGHGAMTELGPIRVTVMAKLYSKIRMHGTTIGNGLLNDYTDALGFVDYIWTHALISDHSYKGISTYCDFVNGTDSEQCDKFLEQSWNEIGDIDYYNIYAPLCHTSMLITKHHQLLHGDVDSVVPVTSSRYSISSLNLQIKTPWYPWYTNNKVGGYAVEYKGVTFVTVRGAGHLVPSYQPERALDMISSFLQGTLPPPSS
ncbi:hypothetical protein LWI28_009263 [Acer negundo]|uniref:Uncharacterized protein n=1 Tax=Acer negundo TaxID=4023 RepID=A0AAD5JJP7_ACENE|nr:hypothetical protein LWI28_009263 [Acer negundo]